LAREIDDRTEQELHPVEESHVPLKCAPFVGAINGCWLGSLGRWRFNATVADAHELRTPPTALSSAELVSEADVDPRGKLRCAGYRERAC
jgi:two-component system OmpR family sensor kinase